MCKPAEIIGERFGRLVVVARDTKNLNKKAYWRCKCDCGEETVGYTGQLRSGQKQSCGCLVRELAKKRGRSLQKHGHSSGGKTTSTYQSWRAMKERCLCINNVAYPNYGGRGIQVCDRWLNSFEAFLEDMGVKPEGKYVIDRIDPNGNYTPDNCQWITLSENSSKSNYQRNLDENGFVYYTVKCNACGCLYTVHKSAFKRGSGKFCTQSCSIIYRRGKHRNLTVEPIIIGGTEVWS